MKSLVFSLAIAALNSFVSASVFAQSADTTLRVGLVRTTFLSSSALQGYAANIVELESALYSTGVTAGNAVSIDVWRGVNNQGTNSPYVVHVLDNVSSSEITNVSMKTAVSTMARPSSAVNSALRLYRESIDADVLVVLADVSGLCGAVGTTGSTFAEGFFTPTHGGLDLSNSENNWISVVNAFCMPSAFKPRTIAHEFSHIAGGTHFRRVSDTPSDPSQGVLVGNKANAYVDFGGARGTAGASPSVDLGSAPSQ
ncbi:MAG: hypothetical protein ACJAR0_003447 [Candidatus Azotimanducaceae bacterium]|jgi:hypothetical protein